MYLELSHWIDGQKEMTVAGELEFGTKLINLSTAQGSENYTEMNSNPTNYVI